MVMVLPVAAKGIGSTICLKTFSVSLAQYLAFVGNKIEHGEVDAILPSLARLCFVCQGT